MTNQDFDQADARELAEFADSQMEDHYMGEHGKYVVHHKEYGYDYFQPWLMTSPQWTRQALLDAVREKGLEWEFVEKLRRNMERVNYLTDPTHEVTFDFVSVPPEAICAAILSMEVE